MITLYLQHISKLLSGKIPFKSEKKVVGHRLGTVSMRGVGAWIGRGVGV